MALPFQRRVGSRGVLPPLLRSVCRKGHGGARILYHSQANNEHWPLQGRAGDCLRTALACILHQPLESVPNFAEGLRAANEDSFRVALERMRAYLGDGVTVWPFSFKVETLEEAMSYVGARNPDSRYIAMGGTKHRGINHAVCCRGAEVEWDPSPSADKGNTIVSGMWPDRTAFAIIVVGVKL